MHLYKNQRTIKTFYINTYTYWYCSVVCDTSWENAQWLIFISCRGFMFLLTSQSIDWNIHFDINILYGFLEQSLRHIDVLYQAEVIPTSLTMLILYMNRGRKKVYDMKKKKENNVPCSNPIKVYMFSMKTINHTSCFRSTFTLI